MEIKVNANGSNIEMAITGRIDTTTAPEFEKKVSAVIGNANLLVLDFSTVEYISSAGLRVLLNAQKQMNAKGAKMVLKHVNELVMEVFETTGFEDILTIE